MKELYQARYNDFVDGWGGDKIAGYFTKHEDAKKAVKGKSAYGDGTVEKLVLFESYQEYLDIANQKLMQSIKSKLTHEERKLLGI